MTLTLGPVGSSLACLDASIVCFMKGWEEDEGLGKRCYSEHVYWRELLI